MTPTPFGSSLNSNSPGPSRSRSAERTSLSRAQTDQFIGAALEIRNILTTVKDLLSQPELRGLTAELANAALACQDKFASLLMTSRDSALVLVARLEDFTRSIAYLVQDGTGPENLAEAGGYAETIYTTATQRSLLGADTRDRLEALNAALEDLEKRTVAYTIEVEVYAKDPMEDVSWKIEALEGHITSILATRGSLISRLFNNFFAIQPSPELMEPLVLDHLPFPKGWKLAPFIQDLFGVCAGVQAYLMNQSAAGADTRELEQKRRELERWKREVEVKRADVKKALLCLSAVSRHFAVLDSKLGDFEDVLATLMQDVQALHDRLEDPWSGITEQEFEDPIFT